ncbi:hypothetical protein GCM10009760_55390 [Kitasatospora kazusensis]|uniref:DUF4439 domain-containing protein n=1 Tax=Kitasatospora kazusensis TaxID=407974 RepID=A0ABN3A775_9ACTN
MLSPTRRTFLATAARLAGAAAAAQLLSGCSDDSGQQGHGADGRRPDADQPLRIRAVAATDTLLAAYDAALAGPGSAQADRLRPLRADLVAHRAALAEGLPPATPSGSPSASVSASRPPSASRSASRPPSASRSASPAASTPAATSAPVSVAALAAAERQAAGDRLGDLLAASPELARLLAAVSASDALHAAVLGDPGPITAPKPTAATASPAAPPAPSVSGSAAPTATPSASATRTPLPGAAVTALQAALAAEHAAVYGYGVIGGHLPAGPQRDDCRASYTAHQARRDAWQRMLTTEGATPAAAAPGYQLPFAVTTPGSAGDLAVRIEAQLTGVYAELVAAATGPLRLTAAAALREAALNARHWGGTLPALPGLPPADPTPSASASTSPSASPSTSSSASSGASARTRAGATAGSSRSASPSA